MVATTAASSMTLIASCTSCTLGKVSDHSELRRFDLAHRLKNIDSENVTMASAEVGDRSGRSFKSPSEGGLFFWILRQ